jgi:ribonuclease BN (tRNA processing enzyme)
MGAVVRRRIRKAVTRSGMTKMALLLLVGCLACEPSGSTDFATKTYVVLLGTGTPNPDPDRAGPGVAVVANGAPYLVDAGVGIVRRAAAAAEKGASALAAENLDRVFITHLHSDHTLGLADLIFTPWVLERERPLEAYGPQGLALMTEHLLAAYEQDVRRRVEGAQPQNATGYRVNVYAVQPGEIYRDSNIVVSAFPVRHEEWDEAYGYRFETADAVIVISGDTRPSQAVVEACNGCDILIHEVYSDAGFARREPDWQRYHAAAHTSASELAAIASRARPGLLVLYHQLFWGTSEEDLVSEVRAGYDGRVVSGRDLDVYIP